MHVHRTQFSIEPFVFDGEFAEEENAEFSNQEWEDEASRRRQMPRRSTRPRVRPRPWLVRARGASEYVCWVQSSLNQIMDLRLAVDGVMDPALRSALRSFQKQQGLPVDGIVGPDTERALLAVRGGQPATKRASQAGQPEPAETEYAEQAWESWKDEVPPSSTLGSLMPVPGIENTSQAFRQKVIEMAQRLGADPNFLMAIMSFESNGFNPQARNPQSGATGLIQFMPKTAEKLGTTTDALARMTAEQQLDYVAKYFAPYTGRLKTLEDAYMAVLWPPAVGQGSNYVLFSSPSTAYQQNQLLDLNKDGKITVTEAAAMVRKRLGSGAPSYSTGFFKDLPDLQTVNLSPSSPVAINSGWPLARRTIASIYNRLGGLMSAVAGKTQIEVPAVLAVWKVEGGNLPHNPGKAVIRFENHLLYRLWGKNNDATYAQYFRHGGYMGQSGNPWENHQYREGPNQPFRSSHSNQDAEYLVLGLAARLASEEIALQCISIGGPQILISNYSLIGYRTPREMYNAFQASERSHVLGFFDYCQQKEKEKGGLLRYLRAKDFRNFAYYYNGSGQVDYYGRMIQEAYNEARQIPFELNPEFDGDFEGEEEWGRRRSFPRGGVGPSTARALIEAGVSQPLKDEGQELFEYGYYGEIPLGAADYELEEEVNRQSPEYAMWVQQALNKILGLRLAVDGITGTQTRSAIRSFQQREGLLVDGIVGPQTEGALIRAGAGNPPGTAPAPDVPGSGIPPQGTPDIVSVRGIQVARQIASQVEALLAAAEADGVKLSGGGYRSIERQIELRKQNCGSSHYDIYEKPSSQCSPPTAPPGRSQHEKGLAIDFTYNGQGIETRDNPGFQWLASNAARFGLKNLPSEPWHWSVDGR